MIRDERGATVVEFGIILPLLLMALFGLIEGARLIWMDQALDQAAYSTARCRTIASAACDSAAKQVSYAVQRAKANGVTVLPANVVIDPAATCGGSSGALLVTLTVSFGSPVGKLLPLPQTVRGRSCVPALPKV
ncbi:TadE/TadG family type IV pilus assembly protein [Sphingomonas sp. 8AM]|uniref:TadE/TadG family type IV pilus assembly protein n=1 Tax=Sphingomonas sp. 8AM TaxID=2653170 RepID=UPI0012F1DDDE|nr:TadE/TadG family type IV pilus assembly protein [Sphingomonas sp. 8AM]VXC69292.1 TadE family protein [Sphingomonas sp. 8AM]